MDMKIMQVLPVFQVAGAETMCETLCISLAERKHEVQAVSLYTEETPLTQRLRAAGIPIHFLNKRPGMDLSIYWKLFRLFRKEKPDVVHTHIYAARYALPVAVLCKVNRRIHTVHSVAQKEQKKIGQRINRILFHYGHVTPVALSPQIQKTVCDVYGLKEKDVPWVFNGVPLERCKSKAHYALSGKFTLLHIGRFMEVKNHEMILRAFAKFNQNHPETCLQLIGDGALRGRMAELAAQLGLKDAVEFLGLQENVFPFLEGADVFILPSQFEGMPLALMEAMGAALPIIASNTGGIPDMVKDGESALLIEPREADLLLALESLYQNPALREKLGRAARERSLLFSAQEMAAKYERIYHRQ